MLNVETEKKTLIKKKQQKKRLRSTCVDTLTSWPWTHNSDNLKKESEKKPQINPKKMKLKKHSQHMSCTKMCLITIFHGIYFFI
jgi:hypothetical protein